MRKFLIGAVLAVGLCGSLGCTRIGPGHVGIVVNNAGSQRGVEDFPVTTGWVSYTPGKTSVYEYPTFIQNVVWTKSPTEGHPSDESITFSNKDKMLINMDVNLAYRLDPAKIPAFYVQFRNDDLTNFTDGFMRNTARDCINEVGGTFEIADIMGNNAKFLADSRACLQERLSKFGVVIEQFGVIGAPRPPQSVINAINATTEATQIAIQKQNEVVQATAEAQKRVALAKGEAEANELLTKSLSPQLLEWRKLAITEEAVRRWDGKRPSVEGAGSGGILLQVPAQH